MDGFVGRASSSKEATGPPTWTISPIRVDSKELEAESRQRQRECDAQWDASGHNTKGRLDDEDFSGDGNQPPPRLSVNSCLLTPDDVEANNAPKGDSLFASASTTDKDVPFDPNLASGPDPVEAEQGRADRKSVV